VSKLKIVVIYDRWDPPQSGASAADEPIVRELDRKEVETEVAEALTKLGHEPVLHCLDGTTKSLHALARMECDLVFNLAESFAGNDTADVCIASYLELLGKRFTGSGIRWRPRRSSRSTGFTRPSSPNRSGGGWTSRTTSSSR
jgi:D-alanine-D-alanine ligase